MTNITPFKKLNEIDFDFYFDTKNIFDEFDMGIIIINENGQIIYSNELYQMIFEDSSNQGSIFDSSYDKALFTGYKNKKSVEGYILKNYKNQKVYAKIKPLYKNSKFKGVIGIYELKEEENIIKIEKFKTQIKKNIKLKKEFKKIIGENKELKKILFMAQKVSKTNSTIMIKGESGTGKELLSNAIHNASDRNEEPFISINCSAIPKDLMESEFFGYEKGAFTGANKRKIGKFEYANKGTIFLDEIGDMPLELQTKLLRVLQEREIERVGGNETIKIDLRIIAATNRDLEQMVKNKEFREDLYYRLNVIPMNLPSLKERKEDIPLLVEHFNKELSKKYDLKKIKLTNDSLNMFINYSWPGNIRELQNIIERLLVLNEGEEISIKDLPQELSNIYEYKNHKEIDDIINIKLNGVMPTFKEYEKEIIKKAMKKYKTCNKAAKALGLTNKTVSAKVQKYNIEYK